MNLIVHFLQNKKKRTQSNGFNLLALWKFTPPQGVLMPYIQADVNTCKQTPSLN